MIDISQSFPPERNQHDLRCIVLTPERTLTILIKYDSSPPLPLPPPSSYSSSSPNDNRKCIKIPYLLYGVIDTSLSQLVQSASVGNPPLC